MRTRLFVVLIIVGAVPPLHGQSTNIDGAGPTVFVDVNVIPMDRERVLPNQTVLVQDGRIAALGPSDAVVVPAGAIRIDGTNRYLLPGLVDMHVHLRRPIDLDLLIANGVTSARVMSGSARSLELRAQIAGGELRGPNLYTAGPILEGMPPPGFEEVIPINGKVLIATGAEAAAEVARQKAAGYDFVKVYNNLPAEAYRGLVEAAKTHGLPVIGHVPIKAGLTALSWPVRARSNISPVTHRRCCRSSSRSRAQIIAPGCCPGRTPTTQGWLRWRRRHATRASSTLPP